MSDRLLLAANAPKDIPAWFAPKMPRPCPQSRFVHDETGVEYVSAQDVADDRVSDANATAIAEWKVEYQRQQMAQWPWYYANLVMMAQFQWPCEAANKPFNDTQRGR